MSQKIFFEPDGNLGVIRMDDGKANAMQDEFFDQLMAALDEAEKAKSRALIVTGRERFFSGGLDLKVLPALGPEKLKTTTGKLAASMERLFLFPTPVIAASQGHNLAGGLILYCTADHRIALDDDSHKYGLNETANGIPLGGVVMAVAQYSIPPAHHTDMILHAHVTTAKDTLAKGLTQELAATPAELLEKAKTKAKELMRLNPVAYRATKLNLRRPAIEAAKAAQREMGGAGANPFAGLQM